jgi:hypothetical protein
MARDYIKIEGLDQTFETGDNISYGQWVEDPQYTPKPKTQYTIGGVPKRSIPNQRFGVQVDLTFANEKDGDDYLADFLAFKDFFYDSSLDYLIVTFDQNPYGKSTNVLAMNFIDNLVTKNQMAHSVEVSFILDEVLYLLES